MFQVSSTVVEIQAISRVFHESTAYALTVDSTSVESVSGKKILNIIVPWRRFATGKVPNAKTMTIV